MRTLLAAVALLSSVSLAFAECWESTRPLNNEPLGASLNITEGVIDYDGFYVCFVLGRADTAQARVYQTNCGFEGEESEADDLGGKPVTLSVTPHGYGYA